MAKITNTGVHIVEGSAAASDTGGESQIWVKSDTPSSLYHTDDAGTDFRINGTTVSAEQATTSGTSIDFTGIPAGVKRITLLGHSVSGSGTDEFMVQLGDSGGIETSGYLSRYGRISGTGAATEGSTAGFIMFNDAASLLNEIVLQLFLQDVTNNTWVATYSVAVQSTTITSWGAGSKALNGTLDRVRLTHVSGSDTFDAGAASIQFD
jgi:hypothetical protein